MSKEQGRDMASTSTSAPYRSSVRIVLKATRVGMARKAASMQELVGTTGFKTMTAPMER